MNQLDVATELHTRLKTIPDLTVYLGPTHSVAEPCAVVALPDEIEFDKTYGRGSDKILWPILVLIARNDDTSVMKRMSQYCSGSGEHSVKAALEAPDYTYQSCDSVFVEGANLDTVTWGTVDYQGALFRVHIFGAGN